MAKSPKPLSEITHQAFRVLSRELGTADTIRFINQFSIGHGDYTEERQELFGDLSLDDILTEMEADRIKKAVSSV